MEITQEHIVSESIKLFMKFGMRSVTMDDVSRELGISKKTLYKFVKNKIELVDLGVKGTFNTIIADLGCISTKTDNAIDELFNVDEYFDEMMRSQHPAMLFQLKKYHPKTFAWLDQEKNQFILNTTLNNLRKGTEQGLYREDLNHNHIAYIYLAHTIVMESDSFPTAICESTEFHRDHVLYHIRGIATPKGLEYLNKKLQKK